MATYPNVTLGLNVRLYLGKGNLFSIRVGGKKRREEKEQQKREKEARKAGKD